MSLIIKMLTNQKILISLFLVILGRCQAFLLRSGVSVRRKEQDGLSAVGVRVYGLRFSHVHDGI